MIAEGEEDRKICKIALLVSISCVLQITESLIPSPFPGLRLGLANVMVLIALVTLDFKSALEVALLRTLLSSFIIGTFMSCAFILSFSGAFVSTLMMGFLYWLARIKKYCSLSIVGISIIGALSHNFVQLYLVYFMLIRHKGIFIFFPWLSIGALFMGWLTGIIAGNICIKIKGIKKQERIEIKEGERLSALELRHYVSGDSFFHRQSPQIKIISLFFLSLGILIFSNFRFYLCVSLFLIITARVLQIPFGFLFLRMKKCASLIYASFLFPLFFNSGTHVVSRIAYFKITSQGFSAGALFASRVILLTAVSALLIRTTSLKDLTEGLTKTLLPLRPLGISEKRIARIFSLSWMAIPVFWEMARSALCRADLKRIKNLRNVIPVLTDIIATLYLEGERSFSKNYL